LTHNLFDCIECGACSYVCPSTIPLVQYYRHAKADIRAQQANKLKADRARSRFEAHQARLAEQEAEKERKRIARQSATAAINAELAQTQVPVAAAPAAPEELAAKLQRHQQSAQERLARLQQQAAEEQDPARQEKLAASIKQAQLRLNEAQAKLNQLQSPAAKAIEKLTASPQQLTNQAISTLYKQLAITEAKLAEAQSNNLPTLNALSLAVEKLRHKIQQAEAEQPTAPAPSFNQPTAADPATLAAAEQALARLAAKKNQSAEEKQQALKESLQKRIAQLQQRIASSEEDKIAVLRESLATLEARLDELNREN
ncbi:MAG TPA: electron transport complex subunit RsxC, partial [Cellvibrionaceae bacterium]|nr:electron transport complex subunit RsxC [Cellvibrionaceae bacterium]